jgi:hypothetical protein
MIAQLKMRNRAYAEIVPGPSGFMEQLLPRHPDRVTPERLPNGRLRYKLTEVGGGSRYVTQDEMFVIRDISMDGGLNPMLPRRLRSQRDRHGPGGGAVGRSVLQDGHDGALLATYTGEMDEDQERDSARLDLALRRRRREFVRPDAGAGRREGVESRRRAPEGPDDGGARVDHLRGRARPAHLAAQADGPRQDGQLRVGLPGRDRPRRQLPAPDHRADSAVDSARSRARERHVSVHLPPGRAAQGRPGADGRLHREADCEPGDDAERSPDDVPRHEPGRAPRPAVGGRQPARHGEDGAGPEAAAEQRNRWDTAARAARLPRQRRAVSPARTRGGRETGEEARERRVGMAGRAAGVLRRARRIRRRHDAPASDRRARVCGAPWRGARGGRDDGVRWRRPRAGRGGGLDRAGPAEGARIEQWFTEREREETHVA